MFDLFRDEDFGVGCVDEIKFYAILIMIVSISLVYDCDLKEEIIQLFSGEVKRLVPYACFFEEYLCAVIRVGLEFLELLRLMNFGVLIQLFL